MKTLCLLRHAHSEPAPPGVDDHDRILSARGEREAENVGAFMREQRLVPDALLASTSTRTRETGRLAFEVLFGKGRTGVSQRTERALYLADPDVIIDEIRETDDRHGCLVVIGHNPGFEDLAEKMAGAGGQTIGKFPPAAMGVFTFDIDAWRELHPKHAKLKLVFMP